MKFHKTDIPGVFLVEAEPLRDERGFFARLYCPDEFAAAGLDFKPMQTSLSRNFERYTLRGMHYRNPPHAESKLVHVTRGSAYDVVVDVRRDSPAYGRWVGFELDAVSARAIFIPEGCAHGFLTLTSDTDILYAINRAYTPGHDRGYRWNDPRLNIHWPAEPAILSAADREWPDFMK